MKTAIMLASGMLLASLVLADHQNVISDDKMDFASFKTFSVREGTSRTTRPELNNKLILKKTGDAIRAQLVAKGLKEEATRGDLLVDFTLGEDRPHGPSETFDRGELVIDMTARGSNAMVWHGVYTDEDSAPAKVAEKLPRAVQKLLSRYPAKKKK